MKNKVKQLLFVGANFNTIAPKERDAWFKWYAKKLRKAIGKNRKDVKVVLYDRQFVSPSDVFLVNL